MTALVLRGRVPAIPQLVRWGLLVAGLLCLRAAQAAVFISDPGLPHDFAHIAPRYLVALPGCLCLFFSVLHLPAGRLQRPFIYLGKISYGLYVYHVLWLSLGRHVMEHLTDGRLNPVLGQLCGMLIALPGTIATGMLSYRYLESPFLRFKKRFTVVFSRPV